MARASQETAIFSVGPEKSGACEPLGQPVIWTSTAWDGNANRTNERPQRDDVSSNRHPSPAFYLSMIFAENRLPLFGIMF
jgi:hypothetical protein